MERLRRHTPATLLALVLATVLFLTMQPYGWNPSSFFHMDAILATGNPLPTGFVVLDVPAYDGAQYYQIARNVPRFFDADGWSYMQNHVPTAYGYQRIFLPLLAFLVSFGQPAALPWAFLLINLLSIIGAFVLFPGKKWYPLSLALSPAAMVGLHFHLAEPLTLILITAFLVRFVREEKLDATNILLLCLLVLTREVNIFFAGFVGLWVLVRRQWHDVGLAFLPLLAFLALHGWIWLAFGRMPFLESTGKSTLPFEGVWNLLIGTYGYDRLTVTSIPLFLLFVLPGIAWVGWLIVKNRDRSFLAWGTLAFLLLMCAMPDHIVGSITSIGRVITPVYPLALFLAAKQDAWPARWLAASVLAIGLGAAFALASIVHPFTLSA